MSQTRVSTSPGGTPQASRTAPTPSAQAAVESLEGRVLMSAAPAPTFQADSSLGGVILRAVQPARTLSRRASRHLKDLVKSAAALSSNLTTSPTPSPTATTTSTT